MTILSCCLAVRLGERLYYILRVLTILSESLFAVIRNNGLDFREAMAGSAKIAPLPNPPFITTKEPKRETPPEGWTKSTWRAEAESND